MNGLIHNLKVGEYGLGRNPDRVEHRLDVGVVLPEATRPGFKRLACFGCKSFRVWG